MNTSTAKPHELSKEAEKNSNGFFYHVILILFFLSGVSALIYQIVWLQMAGLVFGIAPFAAATILSAFMAGLALGSLYCGKLADRSKNPLILFAFLEIGIGISALLVPFGLSKILQSQVYIELNSSTNFFLLSLFRFLMVFSLLLIPTFLMGGTLPVLSKLSIQNLNILGKKIGTLSSVNNLGAAAGCFLASFIFIRLIGITYSAYIAMTINIVIALSAFVLNRFTFATLSRFDPEKGDISTPDSHTTPKRTEILQDGNYGSPLLIFLLVVFTLSGFVSMVYHVLWMRMLSALAFANAVYSFSTVSIAFLMGTALGSFIYAKFLDKGRDKLTLFGIIQVVIGMSALFLLPVFNKLPSIIAVVCPPLFGDEPSWSMCIASEFLPTFFLMVLPTTLMGMTLPLMSKIYTRNLDRLGDKIGLVNSLDTVGPIFGSFAAAFLLIPLLGIQKSIFLLSFSSIAMGAIVVYLNPYARRGVRGIFSACLALALLLSIIHVPFDFKFWRKGQAPMEKLLYYNEDVAGTTTVREYLQGNNFTRVLEIDGTNVAGTSYMLKSTQKIQGHLPLLLHPDPNQVLIVGFGSGGTTRAVSLHDLEKVVGVELVPSVVDAATKHFYDINQGVVNDSKVHIKIGDGRNYVATTQEKYDVILTESVHPIYSGNGSLYGKEYFERCRYILRPNGIMSVWIPIWALPDYYFKMIIKTFQNVFPNSTVWYVPNSVNRQVLLIGSKDKYAIDINSLKTKMFATTVGKDLEDIKMNNPFLLLSSFMAGPKSLRDYAKETELNSDNHPRLEYFTYPYLTFSDLASFNIKPVYENLSSLMQYRKFSELKELLANDEEAIEKSEEILFTYFKSSEHTIQGIIYSLRGEEEQAIREYEKSVDINPEDKSARHLLSQSLEYLYVIRGNELQFNGDIESAILFYKKALQHNRNSSTARYNLALAYWKKGKVEEAITELKTILQINPKMEMVREILLQLEQS